MEKDLSSITAIYCVYNKNEEYPNKHKIKHYKLTVNNLMEDYI